MTERESGKAVIRHASAFSRSFAFAFGIVGALAYFEGADWRSRWGLLAVVLAAHWTAILHLTWLWLAKPSSSFLSPPPVLSVNQANNLLVVETRPWLSVGVSTSIYKREGEFDLLIGTGEVQTVREDGRSQIRFYSDLQGIDDQDRLALELMGMQTKNIIVRPGLHRRVEQ